MAQQINTTIVLRNDTKAAWEAVKDTATLRVGEFGVESDTGLFKIGAEKIVDGEKVLMTWGELPYANEKLDLENSEDLQAILAELEQKIADGVTEDLTNSVKVAASLEALGNGKVVGDMGIVKAPLYTTEVEGEIVNSDEYTYTAYVWNGTAWAAMDGNYSAENVFTSRDITLAGNYSSIGNYAKGKKIEKGTSLQALFSGMLQTTLQPTVTNPTASITIDSVTKKEVGETYIKPGATLTAGVGSYTYGPATGVTYGEKAIRLAFGADETTATSYVENAAGASTVTIYSTDYAPNDTTAYFTDAGQKYTFSGFAKNSQGVIAHDNLGENSNPEKRVAANCITVTDQSTTVKGGRYQFYGVKSSTAGALDVANLTSAQIRALTKTSLDGGLPTSLSVPVGSVQVIFAAVAGKYSTLVAKDANAADATVSFDKIAKGAKVEGAIAKIGDTSTEKEYDIWCVTWTDPIASAKALTLTWS